MTPSTRQTFYDDEIPCGRVVGDLYLLFGEMMAFKESCWTPFKLLVYGASLGNVSFWKRWAELMNDNEESKSSSFMLTAALLA
jgi:hypothetical protein